MSEISLSKLCLRNFQGIKEFCLDAQSKKVKIYGDNGAGKSTLFNAFTWLLFDKNSDGKKDFQIKTLDRDGNELHGLEHEVEAVLMIDGKPFSLRKVYKEKWTKKRGSATAEFTGHETDYHIDGVPAKKGEYTSRVDQIVSEEIFKLLTNPAYFNEQLHWQKRREILLEVCGDVSNEDVIASNKELSKLPSILGSRSIEDHRKVIAAKRAEINRELEKIPVRIDEVQRSIPNIEGLDEAKIQRVKEVQLELIQKKESELSRIQSGGEVAVKEKQLREIEGELLQIKNQLQADTLDKVSVKRQDLSSSKNQQSELQRKISDKRWSIDRNNIVIEDSKAEASKLRQQWHEVNGETFESHHDTNCPTCGQLLPEEQVQAAHDKALANFNLSKSQRLEDISKKGKAAAGEAKRFEQENAQLSKELEVLEQQLTSKEKEIHSIESELNILQSRVTDVATNPQYIQKQQEADAIEKEIAQLQTSAIEKSSTVREEIAKLRSQIGTLDQAHSRVTQAKEAEQRIEQLKDHEKELASDFERLEHELYLSEEFIRTKVNLLESKINSKFRYARFKLFDPQINGGLTEVCETLFGGVPYSSGLNNAARINVGLDIIGTLSEHYGFIAPIFIDNAEAVTKLIETKGQTICLVVSESDKQLRVEYKEEF